LERGSQTMSEAEHLLVVQNEAGESPHWDADKQVLYWADIVDPHLYRFEPTTGELETFKIDIHVTGIGLRKAGGVVMASKSGLHLWDGQLKEHRFIVDPEADKPDIRFNDGLVGPLGSYWAGTLNEADFSQPVGSLYRLSPDCTLHMMDTGFNLPNGIGWSSDYKTMYLVDSLAQVIYAYEFDCAAGTIANRRIFAQIPEESGMPDGLTVDSEGYVWTGHWGGWHIARYDPDGNLERKIWLPVANVTSLIFGGADLDELYITTAWYLLDDKARKEQPLAGDLFRVRPGVRGLRESKFGG
jgi:sugar lactone lactonase YvrE